MLKLNHLPDGRSGFVAGTVLVFDHRTAFRIDGDIIGAGGTGLLYPAVPLNREGDRWTDAAYTVVLKEYFPMGASRHEDGSVVLPDG